MRRKLRLIDRVLLVLATIGDLVEEIHDPSGWMAGYYRNLYGWVPDRYKRSNFRKEVEMMLRTDLIEKVTRDGRPFLRIISGGKRQLKRDFPIFAFRKEKWDGICTFMSFDIEEIIRRKRDSFRNWLYSIGAGKMQQSAYLLPYDLAVEVKELIKNFGLTKQVRVFLTTLDFIDDKKVFARKVWKLERVEKKYEEILALLEFAKKIEGGGKEKVVRKAKTKFTEALILDPLLPRELLPDNWVGERVRKSLKSSLRSKGF